MLAVSHVSCATLCLLFALCLSPLNSSYQFADFTLTLVGIIFDYFVCVCVRFRFFVVVNFFGGAFVWWLLLLLLLLLLCS